MELTGFLCLAVPNLDLAIYGMRDVKNQEFTIPTGRDLVRNKLSSRWMFSVLFFFRLIFSSESVIVLRFDLRGLSRIPPSNVRLAASVFCHVLRFTLDFGPVWNFIVTDPHGTYSKHDSTIYELDGIRMRLVLYSYSCVSDL